MIFIRPENVDKNYIELLLNKFNENLQFTNEEMKNFYYVENNKFVLCFNQDGTCNIEEFHHYFAMLLYCWTDIPDYILCTRDAHETFRIEPKMFSSDTTDTIFKGLEIKKPR